MAPITRWCPGTPIIIREHWNSRIWTAKPVTVVEDSPDLIALYMMPDTTHKYPRSADGGPIPHFLPDRWVLHDRQWVGGGALYLAHPGSWYVTTGFLAADNRSIECWYINLQTPFRRTALGFDYLDQELDIVIDRELAEWAWKDEAEFRALQQRGRISPGRAAHVRRVGESVIRQLEAGRFTLPRAWIDWRPPATWPVPQLPPNWHHL